ncbi:hypothetical protein [Acinetobacter radioresistens]|uniref:hypothetical protein n=1 Tax=Acinetobacter radioresistens TaxID=40216 RepID=UPI002247CF93|nr:hypothetical protein [Acinetobacter radioresistens]MCX0338306.1 hypothetical protein [Acinetobacter radioresistens]
MKRLWLYGTSTPIQRIGVIVLGVGLLSLFSWMIKEDLSFEDLFNSYYLPSKRDSMFFHLFFYLIPLGFLMSWGYQILVKTQEWIFGKTKENKKPLKDEKLYFKDNMAAYDFASTIYSATLDLNTTYVGLIKDVVLTTNERFQYTIELANTDTTIKVYGYNDENSQSIRLGNLVLWRCEKPVSNKNYFNIQALGTIIATLQPVFDPNHGTWLIQSNFAK